MHTTFELVLQLIPHTRAYTTTTIRLNRKQLSYYAKQENYSAVCGLNCGVLISYFYKYVFSPAEAFHPTALKRVLFFEK